MALDSLAAASALDNASLEQARHALEEVARASDPDAASETLRRALFHDRLPSVDMTGDAYLALRDALLPGADDDFARRCDVVAAVMVARAEGRLVPALENDVSRSLAEMAPSTKKSAARWLLGQLFDGELPRVGLADADQTGQHLAHAAR